MKTCTKASVQYVDSQAKWRLWAATVISMLTVIIKKPIDECISKSQACMHVRQANGGMVYAARTLTLLLQLQIMECSLQCCPYQPNPKSASIVLRKSWGACTTC